VTAGVALVACLAPAQESVPAGLRASCSPGWKYCGQHPRIRDAVAQAGLPGGDLYFCESDQSLTQVESCPAGCEIHDPVDDACAPSEPAATECASGYWYCGSHPRAVAAGVPSAGDLYFCTDGRFAREGGAIVPSRACSRGCALDPANGDDACLEADSALARIPDVPLYAQTDPRWSGAHYAVSECGGSGTIGFCGCTMTALTMAAAWTTGDASVTPACVNHHYGWAVGALGAVVHLGDRVGHPLTWMDESSGYHLLSVDSDPAVVGETEARLLEEVKASIVAGSPVILGLRIDYFGGGWSRHTVVAVGVAADGDILLNDPSTGTVTRLGAYRRGVKGPFRGYDRADAVPRPASPPGPVPCE
jgi:hypothetical protein